MRLIRSLPQTYISCGPEWPTGLDYHISIRYKTVPHSAFKEQTRKVTTSKKTLTVYWVPLGMVCAVGLAEVMVLLFVDIILLCLPLLTSPVLGRG